MASQSIHLASLECQLCQRRFTHNSPLVRHQKRCSRNVLGPVKLRQKSCRQCASSKVRCDLQRPRCSKCQARSGLCEYPKTSPPVVRHAAQISEHHLPEDGDVQPDGSGYLSMDGDSSVQTVSERTETVHTQATTPDIDPLGSVQPQLVISPQRRRVLLGTIPNTPNSDRVTKHTMHFVIRVLKSWPRMMAAHDTTHLPPIMHRVQLADSMPTPLANCYTLVKMWAGHTDGSRELVKNTILSEVQRLIREHHSYNEMDLLAAAQSLLILLIIILLSVGQNPAVAHAADAQLLIDVWGVKHRLAATGLFLEQEANHSLPPWEKWAAVSAKRRTILGFHHLEWAWSVLHGYPTLTCYELGPLPAPAARYLWQETDKQTWARLYYEWLRQWKDGSYKMVELFGINPGASLEVRSEMWLAEADEFGMMLMAEVNAISIEES